MPMIRLYMYYTFLTTWLCNAAASDQNLSTILIPFALDDAAKDFITVAPASPPSDIIVPFTVRCNEAERIIDLDMKYHVPWQAASSAISTNNLTSFNKVKYLTNMANSVSLVTTYRRYSAYQTLLEHAVCHPQTYERGQMIKALLVAGAYTNSTYETCIGEKSEIHYTPIYYAMTTGNLLAFTLLWKKNESIPFTAMKAWSTPATQIPAHPTLLNLLDQLLEMSYFPALYENILPGNPYLPPTAILKEMVRVTQTSSCSIQ